MSVRVLGAASTSVAVASPSGDTTGVTDHANIVATIAASLPGQTVEFAPGVYYTNAQISLKSNRTYRGTTPRSGNGTTIKQASGTNLRSLATPGVSLGSTTLSGAMTAHNVGDAMAITLAGSLANPDPASGLFPILIDSEVFICFSGGGTTGLQVIANGTSSHSNGAAVSALLPCGLLVSDAWAANSLFGASPYDVFDITVDGNLTGNPGSSACGFVNYSFWNHYIRCQANNTPFHGFHVTDVTGNGNNASGGLGSEIRVEDCKISTTAGHGFNQTQAVSGNNLDGFLTRFISAGAGVSAINFTTSAGWDVERPHTYGTGGDAIALGSTFATVCRDAYVEDFGSLGFANSFYHGIYGKLAASRGLHVHDCRVNCPEAAYSATASYGVGQVVFAGDGNWYTSQVNANVGNTPQSSPTQWTEVGSPSTSTVPNFQYYTVSVPSGVTDGMLSIHDNHARGPNTNTNFGTAYTLQSSSGTMFVYGNIGFYRNCHTGWSASASNVNPVNVTLGGTGVPAGGCSGMYYQRYDTPGTANQRLYVNNAGSWTGIV